MTSFCSKEDGQAQIRVMYDNGASDLVTSDLPPIEIVEDGLFERPAWRIFGYRNYYNSNDGWINEYFCNFTELPSGWDYVRFAQGFSYGELRVVYNAPFTEFFAFDQLVFITDAYVYPADYYDALTCFVERKKEYDFYVTYRNPWRDPVLPTDKITGDFSPVNNGIVILKIYDDTNKQIYESDPNKGAYAYDISCGDCDNKTQLKVGDDSSKGYQCLPYENLIQWAKIQRQKLNQI